MLRLLSIYSTLAFAAAQPKPSDGHAYTVENLVSGNFTIQTASLSPIDSGSDWEPKDTGNYLFYFFPTNILNLIH